MPSSRLRRFLDRTMSGEATNLIAEGIVIEGQIKGIGSLIVTGRVKGDCRLAGSVTVAEGGSWQGEIAAERILIAGELKGNAQAEEQIEIAQTARIDGDVSASTIAMAEGAVLEGSMHVASGSPPVTFREKRGRDQKGK